jgi:hypothetical protein
MASITAAAFSYLPERASLWALRVSLARRAVVSFAGMGGIIYAPEPGATAGANIDVERSIAAPVLTPAE